VTSRSFSSGDHDARAALEAAGVTLVTGLPNHDLEALRPLLATTKAWIAGTGPVTAEHLEAAPHLQVIARYGVGVDAIDRVAAASHQVVVTNTPGANSGAVADHAVALLLAALRHVVVGDRRVRAGSWTVQRTRQLGQLTVGIVGVGRIGRGVATRLSGFGCTLLGHDPWVPEAELRAAGIEPVGMVELTQRSDIVTLHTPGERPLVDRDWLASVKQGVIVVNTARASLVDEHALAVALADQTVAVYAADTLSSEATGDQASPLLHGDLRDRTLFTPHLAAQTVEAVDNMGRGAVEAVLAVLAGRVPRNLVHPPTDPTSKGADAPTSTEPQSDHPRVQETP